MRATQGENWDEATVLFYGQGQAGQDLFDAENLVGPAVDIATLPLGATPMAINVMPTLAQQTVLPLQVYMPAMGTASLTINGVEGFDAGTTIYLRDALLNTTTPATEGMTVTFSVSANPASQGAGRFSLIFAPAGVTALAPGFG